MYDPWKLGGLNPSFFVIWGGLAPPSPYVEPPLVRRRFTLITAHTKLRNTTPRTQNRDTQNRDGLKIAKHKTANTKPRINNVIATCREIRARVKAVTCSLHMNRFS